MLLLTSTSDKLQVVTASAVTVDVHASYVDNAVGTITPDRKNTAITTATTTDVVTSPAASTQRNVQTLNIRNKHASSSNLVTVRHTDGTTTSELFSVTLLAGETLQYLDGVGFQVFDAAGSKKNAAAVGRWLRTSVLTTGTSFTTLPSATSIFARLQGGGGAGGGVATAATSGGGGGGGAAGGYAEKTFAVSGSTAYTYAIGAAGTPGAAGANNGGAGGDTTFAVGATTVTAKGGPGGIGGTAAVASVNLGGAAPAISTNGDLNASGEPGNPGINPTAAVVASGKGGTSAFGAGGNSLKTQSAGSAGIGFGSGGSGGCLVSAGASVAGGAGTAGVIIVDEYA